MEAESLPSIERVDSKLLSQEQFVNRFEITSTPCLLVGSGSVWPAIKEQTWEPSLLARRLGDYECDLGREGCERMSLGHFLEALGSATSFSNYIFDGAVFKEYPELCSEYSVPHVFPPEDHFLK